MKYSHDIIILGGGAAGLTATAGCAQLGMKTALVENKQLGGDCLHHGCVPSKTLIHTAAVAHAGATAKKLGLSNRSPSIDLSKVLKEVQATIQRIEEHDSLERFTQLGADVLFAQPQFLSPHEVGFIGENAPDPISAPRIVIATGSSPKLPPIPGLQDVHFLTSSNLFYLKTLPKTMVVIGGGPIGVEMAQSFARLGSKVTILETLPQILATEDEDVVEIVQTQLTQEGIKILTGVNITRISAEKEVKKVHIQQGSPISCDGLLLSTGRKGNIEGLDLEKARVRHERGYIVTNSKLQTTARHIMAVGDVNGKILFTHVAGAEGALAVRRLGLRIGGRMNYQTVPWVIYTDPEIASVGYNEKRAKAAGIAYRMLEQKFSTIDRAHTDHCTTGKMKILYDKSSRIIGGQIAGSRAGELLSPLLFAVKERWKISRLRTMYPYPVLSEIHGKAASTYLSPALFNSRVRSILRLLFSYSGRGPKQ